MAEEKKMPENAVAKLEPQAVPEVATPADLLQMAVQQGADLDKLERLMDLQDRWQAYEARKAYVEALAAFKAAPPTVRKTKSASFGQGKTAYDYANLAEVIAVIAPALSQHGLSHTWSTNQDDSGMVAVTCMLTHVMGHSESVTLKAGADTSGSKNPIQAIGSAVTYLQRYTLLAITGLAAADMDDDSLRTSLDLITPEQKAELIELMKESGADTKGFLRWGGVEVLDDLPAAKFEAAKALLLQKKAKQHA